ncbi:hypothetical protein QCA50_011048 [Cerrena zonata]|uniref:Uncharacterized protein n=1 Tax=Cerrena zonata TaxID=2478898 RepID=A0AAW0G5X9_9APHY
MSIMPEKKAAPEGTYDTLQWNMIHAHDAFKLGYDMILKILENPPNNDLANFLGYCLAWASSVEGTP